MGAYIILTAVVAELAFAVFCVETRSHQAKARNMLRIAAFASFVLLVALRVIYWSLRYYALGLLLGLLAAIGTINLLRKVSYLQPYRLRRIVLQAVGTTVLIAVVTLPAVIFPQHQGLAMTGEHQVATVNYTYTDSTRVETYSDAGTNRKVTVGLWFPQVDRGKYPLIVFSHGGFGIKTSNETLYKELASHGYVVCAIDHTYQCLYTTDVDGHVTLLDRGYMQECNEEDARADRQQSFAYYQQWMGVRTGDISFVIDRILAEAVQPGADAAYRLVDAQRIGVMGHSLGGAAALGIGRMRDDVDAVMALDAPFLCDIVGVENGEFVFVQDTYPAPVLNIYSDDAWGLLSDRPQYEANYRLLSDAAATAHNVRISGAGHFSLTDLALSTPALTRLLDQVPSPADATYCLTTINRVTLAFFDCYLKGRGEFSPEK